VVVFPLSQTAYPCTGADVHVTIELPMTVILLGQTEKSLR